MRATAPAPLTRHLQEPAIARAPPVAAQPLPPSANVRERCGPKESVPRSEIQVARMAGACGSGPEQRTQSVNQGCVTSRGAG